MRPTLQIIIILLFTQPIQATILTVKQDSTGDYTTIQAAVNTSVDGDTVLVWPGTYYENVYIEEKNIIVGSLTLTTGDYSYIHNTIVDGNDTSGCFIAYKCDGRVEINGFTLQNGNPTWYGNGTDGGAVLVWYSHTDIFNCMIQNNFAVGDGGGVFFRDSQSYISNVTFRNNQTYSRGGAIYTVKSLIEFDSIDKCNIYLNNAAIGVDVYQGDVDDYNLHLVVDTFTVAEPDYYYLYKRKQPGTIISYDIENEKIIQSYQDLYVAPDGDNNNSGLSPEEPLKTISFALLKMASDSISPDTIHVANGIYSPSSGENFPLSLKRDVSVQGKSRDSTILDAENEIYIFRGLRFADNYKISKLTLQNGNGEINSSKMVGAFILRDNRNAVFEDLVLTSNVGSQVSGGKVYNSNNTVFRNIDFLQNTGGRALRTQHSAAETFYDTSYIENCRFIENTPDYSDPDHGFGGGIAVRSSEVTIPQLMTASIVNCLFVNNHTKDYIWAGSNSLSVSGGSKAYLVNATLADNTSENPEGGNIGVTYSSNLHIYNSVMYNNQPAEIYMSNPENGPDCNLFMQHSLLEGGEEGIRILDEGNNIFYDDPTNIDTDTLFLGKWEHPYQIADGSPCIDAGTLANLPDFIELPEFDLAGNPRIVGDSIDMGAYEWNPTVGIDENLYQPIKINKPKLLQAAPNPFNRETTISAQWDFTGHVQIEIYNNAGLRIKVLKSGSFGPGSIQTRWDGKDQNGNILPAGIYHVVMFWDGKEMEGMKVVKK